MNVNYRGSFAERNMRFSSVVSSSEAVNVEPFHSLSVYIPSNLAPASIVDYADYEAGLTSVKPLLFTCDYSNYAEVMKGELLNQFAPVFREGANVDLVLYLIVFHYTGEDHSTDVNWDIQSSMIGYSPLTKAFERLFFVSYIKMLFDPMMNGGNFVYTSAGSKGRIPVTLTNAAKTKRVSAEIEITLTNPLTEAATILASGSPFSWTRASVGDGDTAVIYNIVVDENVVIAAGGSAIFTATSANDAVIPDTEVYVGQPVSGVAGFTTPVAGTLTAQVTAVNHRGQIANIALPSVIEAGTYRFAIGAHYYSFEIPIGGISLDASGAGASYDVIALCEDIGAFAATVDDSVLSAVTVDPVIGAAADDNQTASIEHLHLTTDGEFEEGTDAGTSVTAISGFFDLSLALAYLCKNNVKLSQFWSQVRLSLSSDGFPYLDDAVDGNVCKIRSYTAAEEIASIPTLTTAATIAAPIPRSNFYWGALKLIKAVNTFLVAHSEPVNQSGAATNVLALVLTKWFESKNDANLYVGNKLHSIRLSGDDVKPFGWASLLNAEVNENDADAADIFDTKKVAYLQTISDSSDEDCRLTMSRTLDGVPVTARMISKWVDYHAAMDCADMITDKGTLTSPLLTDEDAYKKIQSIVYNKISAFKGVGRIVGIKLKFPSFDVAKVGLTALEAASSWSANYIDDLDTVTVTGAISES